MKYNAINFSDVFGKPIGPKLWGFLTRHDSLVMMKTAVKLGRAPVEGIDDALLDEFGDAVREHRTKQMIGHMVRQIMEAEGYQLHSQNAAVRSGTLFVKASRYKRAA